MSLDLVAHLEKQKDPVDRKLENMGAIICSYGAERFGVKQVTQRTNPLNQAKPRRQQEIEQLVKERRQLKKKWKKAAEMERPGLDDLNKTAFGESAKVGAPQTATQEERKSEDPVLY